MTAMNSPFLRLATTPAVRAAQVRSYGEAQTSDGDFDFPPQVLGAIEREFISARDSLYLATVTEKGWPYVQHRGGPKGFLRVLGPRTLGFADVRGNRQLLSAGNLAASNRVALFLMDYPQRSRLKILGHATVVSVSDEPALALQLSAPQITSVERLVRIEVVAYDWNCPKYITPRYTKEEVDEWVAPLKKRIAELEFKMQAEREK